MLRKLESRADWQIALAITASLRLFYSIAAALASPFLHPDAASIRSNALTENLPAPGTWHYALLGVWERFDTLWYLRIAERGYDLPMAVIFYPLYPAAIRLLSWAMPAAAAALVVSTVSASTTTARAGSSERSRKFVRRPMHGSGSASRP